MPTTDNQATDPMPRAYVALAVAMLSVSSGAIFVRYAQEQAPSLTIAAYRMGIAFVVVLIPTWLKQRRELMALSGRDAILAATAGLFLAVHFATWIYSLELTSVVISCVMVNTAPLWVGLLTPLITRDKVPLVTILGIACSVVGALAIGLGLNRLEDSSRDLLGGVLATIGALGLAVYLLIGRKLRARHSLGVYVTVCYAACAGHLFLAAAAAGQPFTGFSVSTWLILIGLALVSQVLGHTTYNWSLRFFSASMISVTLLGEPVCSAALAFLLFDESLTLVQISGAGLILLGIYLASTAERV